jgi:hypothetical protein
MIANTIFVASLQVFVDTRCACLPLFGLSHRVFQSLQGPPVGVDAEIHFLGPLAVWPSCAVVVYLCRKM